MIILNIKNARNSTYVAPSAANYIFLYLEVAEAKASKKELRNVVQVWVQKLEYDRWVDFSAFRLENRGDRKLGGIIKALILDIPEEYRRRTIYFKIAIAIPKHDVKEEITAEINLGKQTQILRDFNPHFKRDFRELEKVAELR